MKQIHFSIDPPSDCAVYRRSIFRSRAITYRLRKTFHFRCRIHTGLVWRGAIFNSKATADSKGINCSTQKKKKTYVFPLIISGTTVLLSCLCHEKCFALSSAASHFLWRHFEMLQVTSHPCVNSCLIYKISIYGSDFKVHPLRFFDREVLCCSETGGTNKNRSLFLSSDNPLQSRGCQKLNLQEHRWICSFLLTDGW